MHVSVRTVHTHTAKTRIGGCGHLKVTYPQFSSWFGNELGRYQYHLGKSNTGGKPKTKTEQLLVTLNTTVQLGQVVKLTYTRSL